LHVRSGRITWDGLEKGLDLRLAVSAMTAKGSDGSELAGLGPSGHGLGIDTKEGSHLCWGQQDLLFAWTKHGQNSSS